MTFSRHPETVVDEDMELCFHDIDRVRATDRWNSVECGAEGDEECRMVESGRMEQRVVQY
jgi:hypothetical protein